MKFIQHRGQALMLFTLLSGALASAQTTEKLWQARFEPAFALNLKSGLKGPGYGISVCRDFNRGMRAEVGLSALSFNSPGTFNPNGSKKFPAEKSSIHFNTRTWELSGFKKLGEGNINPVFGAGLFKRSWKEQITENGVKTSQDATGSSMGLMLSAGAETSVGKNLTLQARTLLHTNTHFYSIWSFRVAIGYRFGLI